jgi:hypothetical protein
VAQQHVDRRLRSLISSSLPQEEWTQSMLLGKTMLEGFDLTWRGAGPETVAIPSDGGKAGDAVVANEVVDLGALAYALL